MRNWHSLYEILEFPIGVIFLAIFLLGFGNILTNPAFETLVTTQSDFIILLSETFMKIGSFMLVNFPLFFLIRLVARKNGSATSVISAVAGYFSFLITTMYFAKTNLPSAAYSSILGISMMSTGSVILKGSVHYPLQTGMIASIVVAFITLGAYSRTRKRSEYSFFSFISKDTACVLRVVLMSVFFGLLVSWAWSYFITGVMNIVDFVASDTTNPVNLALYGITERVLGVFNLATLVRAPFWYNTQGGTWLSMAGISVAGDVNIWSSQFATNAVGGMSGRFITPYYLLNLFAIPGLLWGFFSLHTDKMERRRIRMFYVVATFMSLLSGTLLPVEIALFLLCPLLFVFHVTLTGIMFGILQSMHLYLGFNNFNSNTLTTLPGTLLEFLSYAQIHSMQQTIIRLSLIGIAVFLVYFFMTRIYFDHLAVDLFKTGALDRMVQETVDAVGGIENVRMTHSSPRRLTISLYDPGKLDVVKLKRLGSVRVMETKAGFAITFGAASTMLRIGINTYMRNNIRELNR